MYISIFIETVNNFLILGEAESPRGRRRGGWEQNLTLLPMAGDLEQLMHGFYMRAEEIHKRKRWGVIFKALKP